MEDFSDHLLVGGLEIPKGVLLSLAEGALGNPEFRRRCQGNISDGQVIKGAKVVLTPLSAFQGRPQGRCFSGIRSGGVSLTRGEQALGVSVVVQRWPF